MDEPHPPSSGFGLSGAQRLVLKVLLNAAALWLTAELFDSIRIEGFFSAVFAVIILAFSNTFIRPVLIFLTLPLTLLTLGLFTLVINALLFKLTSALVPGFHVGGFWSALGGALVYSLLTLAVNALILPPPGGPRITFGYRRFPPSDE
jgi:putative membrane protein